MSELQIIIITLSILLILFMLSYYINKKLDNGIKRLDKLYARYKK